MAFIITGAYIAALFGVAMWFIHRHGTQASAANASRGEQAGDESRHHSKVPA
jgi:hypothetical protein